MAYAPSDPSAIGLGPNAKKANKANANALANTPSPCAKQPFEQLVAARA